MNSTSRFLFLRNPWWLIAALIIFPATIYVTMTNTYMQFRDVEVKVVDKVMSQGKYSANFYLIVNSPEYGTFDMLVRPAIYQTAQPGETHIFNLREMDMRQTPTKNIVYFFGQVVLWVIAGLYLIMIIWVYFNPDKPLT